MPTEASRLLLCFLREPGRPEILTVVPIDDSTTALPPGHVNIINLSGLELAADLAGQRFEIKPGLTPGKPIKARSPLHLAAYTVAGWRPAFSTIFELEANERATLVLLPPTSPARPLLPSRILLDRLEEPTPEG